MSGIGHVTEEMKSKGRVEGVKASRRQREREQQMNRHLLEQSSLSRLIPRFLCLASPWDFHSMVASRNIMSSLVFFSQTPIAILGTSCVMSDAKRVDFTYDVNEAGFSDDNLFSTIGVGSTTSFARD
jgi:hypothetical protein